MSRPRSKQRLPQFSLRLDPSLRLELQLMADAEERSLGHFVERVLRQFCAANVRRIRVLRTKAGRSGGAA